MGNKSMQVAAESCATLPPNPRNPNYETLRKLQKQISNKEHELQDLPSNIKRLRQKWLLTASKTGGDPLALLAQQTKDQTDCFSTTLQKNKSQIDRETNQLIKRNQEALDKLEGKLQCMNAERSNMSHNLDQSAKNTVLLTEFSDQIQTNNRKIATERQYNLLLDQSISTARKVFWICFFIFLASLVILVIKKAHFKGLEGVNDALDNMGSNIPKLQIPS